MRVTTETCVDDEAMIGAFWAMYEDSFAPLETLAAARQTLSEGEFRALMAAPSVLKFVAWDRDGDPAALLVLTNDLTQVSWISPRFYEHRYPEQASRNAIYYTVAALVRPDARGSVWFRAVLRESMNYVASRRGVGAIDCCQHNVEHVPIPRIVEALSQSATNVESQLVDTQSYYTFAYSGMKDDAATPQIDLRGDEVAMTGTRTVDATREEHGR